MYSICVGLAVNLYVVFEHSVARLYFCGHDNERGANFSYKKI